MVAKIYVTGGIGESIWYWFAFDRDPVSNDATSTEDLIRIIRDAHAVGNLEAIECTIASCPGGDAIMGIEMHDILKTQGVPVTTRAVGLCASAGGVIFAAGDDGKRIATPGAMFLPHKVTGFGGGNAKDLQDTADTVRMLDTQIATAYANASGQTVEYWEGIMDSEKMLSAKDMLAHGLVTSIEQTVPLNHAKIQKDMKTNFANVLADIKDAANKLFRPTNELPIEDPLEDPAALNLMVETDKGTVNIDGEMVEGAKATVNGEPANGRYMPTDGSRGFECENGEIKIIIESEPEEEPMDNSTNEVMAELANSFKAFTEALNNQTAAQTAQAEAMTARLEAIEAQNKAVIEAQNGKPAVKAWPRVAPPVTGAENTMPSVSDKLAPKDGVFTSSFKNAQ
jgi:ATP-dependent protease ClpP protease subunit